MFSNIMMGSNDLERSKTFYDAIMGAMGGEPAQVDAKGRLIYSHRGGRLMITKPINGEAATAANGGTIGFAVSSVEEGDAWHQAGLANGGTSIEDPPGLRESASGSVYLAYLRDPDGNKLGAIHRLR